jgi:hypothetical protein
MKKEIYQINDRTHKYISLKHSRRLHYYLGLPGEFEAAYPQEIVFPNMDAGRVDDYHSTKDGLLINLEEESGYITEETLEKFGKYVIFGEFMYSKKLYLAVVCHKNPKNFPKYYEKSPSVFIKIHYYHFPQDEMWKRYENIINKVEQKEELSEMEALDIAFIPKFISKEDAPFVTESLAKHLKNAIIADNELKRDTVALLGAMILKNITDETKQIELMEDIGMAQVEDEIRIIAREEYKEEYNKIEKEKLSLQKENNKIEKEKLSLQKENNKIEKEKLSLQKENNKIKEEHNKMKKGIKKLSEMDDLTPEAKNIINSLMIF